MLMPRHVAPAFPGHRDYGKWKGTYLYRRRRPLLARLTLAPCGEHQERAMNWSRSSREQRTLRDLVGHLAYRRLLVSLEKEIKVVEFAQEPEMKLRWSDPGDCVALFLKGEPWAFIHREKNHGYSKGVLTPGFGNMWDQALFDQTFTEA
jgi:hypothetical protein